MSYGYLSEAFKKLNLLQEQTFDASLDGINKLGDFMEEDDAKDVARVIDPEAEYEEDVKPSYIGKVIINCNVCHSYIFENKEDIVVDEDGTVNSEMECPYCGEVAGFAIVGKICPFEDDEEPKADEGDATVSTDAEGDAKTEENHVEECLTEDVDRVRVEADDKVVTVDTHDDEVNVSVADAAESCSEDEPCEPKPEAIEPLTDEEQDELVKSEEEETPEGDEDIDFDMDELDDEATGEVVESYLKNVYENVNSFKLRDASITDDHMLIEGLIKFNSGKEVNTGFLFTPDRVENNRVRLYGMNEHFSKNPRSFALVGCVENKKFIPESLSYNYKLNEQLIKGRVCRK